MYVCLNESLIPPYDHSWGYILGQRFRQREDVEIAHLSVCVRVCVCVCVHACAVLEPGFVCLRIRQLQPLPWAPTPDLLKHPLLYSKV